MHPWSLNENTLKKSYEMINCLCTNLERYLTDFLVCTYEGIPIRLRVPFTFVIIILADCSRRKMLSYATDLFCNLWTYKL